MNLLALLLRIDRDLDVAWTTLHANLWQFRRQHALPIRPFLISCQIDPNVEFHRKLCGANGCFLAPPPEFRTAVTKYLTTAAQSLTRLTPDPAEVVADWCLDNARMMKAAKIQSACWNAATQSVDFCVERPCSLSFNQLADLLHNDAVVARWGSGVRLGAVRPLRGAHVAHATATGAPQ